MEIRDALHHEKIGEIEHSAFKEHLLTLLHHNEDEVAKLREKIMKYEQKTRAEDVLYQSLSPIRKLFASRPPTHHRAVEHMVHVKDRMAKIEHLKKQASELHELLIKLEEHPPEYLILPVSVIEDLKSHFPIKEMFQS